MAVALSTEQDGFVIDYDPDAVEGDTIDVAASNPASGDVSERFDLDNDGHFLWSVPKGYSGVAAFVVSGSDGGEDTGTVTFG